VAAEAEVAAPVDQEEDQVLLVDPGIVVWVMIEPQI
jgi:hypothetical protein